MIKQSIAAAQAEILAESPDLLAKARDLLAKHKDDEVLRPIMGMFEYQLRVGAVDKSLYWKLRNRLEFLEYRDQALQLLAEARQLAGNSGPEFNALLTRACCQTSELIESERLRKSHFWKLKRLVNAAESYVLIAEILKLRVSLATRRFCEQLLGEGRLIISEYNGKAIGEKRAFIGDGAIKRLHEIRREHQEASHEVHV